MGAQAEAKKQPPPAAEKKQATPAAETKQPATAAKHVMIGEADLKWGPAPPGLPAGAQLAVLDGDPGKAGLFTIRVKVPDGYTVPPHWHPTDEHLTVLSGNLMMATGSKWDDARCTTLTAGSYAKMPRRVNHYRQNEGRNDLPAQRDGAVRDHVRESNGRSAEEVDNGTGVASKGVHDVRRTSDAGCPSLRNRGRSRPHGGSPGRAHDDRQRTAYGRGGHARHRARQGSGRQLVGCRDSPASAKTPRSTTWRSPGDIVFNSAYYSLATTLAAGRRPRATCRDRRTTLPKKMGLGDPPKSDLLSNQVMTVAWYVIGGLAAACTAQCLATRRAEKFRELARRVLALAYQAGCQAG